MDDFVTFYTAGKTIIINNIHYNMGPAEQTPVQWNLCIVVTLGPAFYGCIIEGGCITEVHNTSIIRTLGPNKVA